MHIPVHMPFQAWVSTAHWSHLDFMYVSIWCRLATQKPWYVFSSCI